MTKQGHTKVLTRSQVHTMVGLYREGWNMGRLAEHFGVSRQNVWALLKRRGITTRPRWHKRANNFLGNGEGGGRAMRDEAGICVTLVNLDASRNVAVSMHFPGMRKPALLACADWCDQHDGDWRLVAYSTPETILGDLQGKRADVSDYNQPATSFNARGHTTNTEKNPEGRALAVIGRTDLLHPSLDR